jgi:hypothetical protein
MHVKRRVVLAVAVSAAVALMTAGCSSGKAKPAAVTGPTYTPTQASAAVILATDLPTGYAKDPGYRHDPVPGGCAAVDAVLKTDSQLAPSYSVASYRNGDSQSSVDHEVALYATPAAAAAQFDALIKALKACPSWSISLGGATATLSLTPSRPDVIGKRSAVLDLKVDSAAEKFRGREVLAVSGNALVSLAESGPAGSNDDPRIDLLTLTTKLVQRLRAQAG